MAMSELSNTSVPQDFDCILVVGRVKWKKSRRREEKRREEKRREEKRREEKRREKSITEPGISDGLTRRGSSQYTSISTQV